MQTASRDLLPFLPRTGNGDLKMVRMKIKSATFEAPSYIFSSATDAISVIVRVDSMLVFIFSPERFRIMFNIH